jgi:hypothetical protein
VRRLVAAFAPVYQETANAKDLASKPYESGDKSPHSKSGQLKGISNALTTDQRGAGFPRTSDNGAIPPAVGGDNTDIGAFEVQVVSGPCAPDVTPPVITCPGGLTKFTDSGQFTATVNPGAPVASDNCALQSVTGVRSDGKALNAPYPIGVTLITWTARDASGNTASCGQSIAVMVPSGERRRIP